MGNIPKALAQTIDAFSKLPGVGPRSAERFAYWCLRHDQNISTDLANCLLNLHNQIKVCPVTFALIDISDDVSPIYSDPGRDKTTIAVVAEPFDIVALEKASGFNGTYHVLGGHISPIDGIGPDNLHISELLSRIEKDNVKEIILATNASVDGETTAIYLHHQIANKKIKITRLARGLPIGIDLEYADQITLKRALEGRTLL